MMGTYLKMTAFCQELYFLQSCDSCNLTATFSNFPLPYLKESCYLCFASESDLTWNTISKAEPNYYQVTLIDWGRFIYQKFYDENTGKLDKSALTSQFHFSDNLTIINIKQFERNTVLNFYDLFLQRDAKISKLLVNYWQDYTIAFKGNILLCTLAYRALLGAIDE